MYAVVSTGGKQLKVAEGDVVRVEKIEAEVGATIELGPVHLIAGDAGITVEPQALSDAKVVCEVTGHGRGKKIRVFKFKKRKNYHRTYGHRQDYTELKVNAIQS